MVPSARSVAWGGGGLTERASLGGIAVAGANIIGAKTTDASLADAINAEERCKVVEADIGCCTGDR
jgi:hypothetical protein